MPLISARCSALDQHGRQCRRVGTHRTHYHGDREIYGWMGPEPSWVRVTFCAKHYDPPKKSRKKR